MKQLTTNNLLPTHLKSGHSIYHSIALVVSCVVLCSLIGQFLWQNSTAAHLATVTLAAYYTLIRFIQLLTLRKRYPSPPLTHGSFIVFDQIYLGVITLAGMPVLLTLPLSGALLYATRAMGSGYLLIAIPTAFMMMLLSLSQGPVIQLDLIQSIAISLITVVLPNLLPLKLLYLQRCEHDAGNTRVANQNDEITESENHLLETESSLSELENGTQRILILSKNDDTTESISRYLKDWGYEYTASRNCVQAFKHMLSRRQGEVFIPYNALIVDQHELDIDPRSLVGLIRDEAKLDELKLICLKSPAEIEGHAQRLLEAGYATLLENPVIKAQLFSAIMGEPQHFPDSTNIVSLSKHRVTKKNQPRQGAILLADSPSTERTLLGKKLIQAGYHIRIVDNGDQALDALEERGFDLAIANMKMPVMSGTQVVKLHRFTTPYKHWVPFIFMTDENTPDTLRLCRSIGVQACLFKPVTADDLLEMIPTVLDQHQSLGPARDNYRSTSFEHNITQFQHSRLLDNMTLLRLERLDNGIAFISDLFKIFEAEGHVIIRTMRRAVERNQLGQFLDQAQNLLDSAGQLGAFVLYELNQQATKVQANEFEYKGPALLEEIEHTFSLTLQAYDHYLSQRTTSQHTDKI
ncbi:MAG: response regulator [Candidatus Thiodiazotropha sp. (ex Codakia rugifera)]|nr:response regulator [Candidatus Thiodiazotropha sp. (ex Codakia rugifera)]